MGMGNLLVLKDKVAAAACPLSPGDGGPQTQFSYECAAAMSVNQIVAFDAKSGIASPGGVPAGVLNKAATNSANLVDVHARSETLDFHNVDTVEGCKTIRD